MQSRAGYRRVGVLAAVNVLAVWSYIWLIVHREAPWLAFMLPLSAMLILLQVPVLVRLHSRVLQVALLFATLLVFLFLSGMILSWSVPVGGRPPGSWAGRLDGGLRMALFGLMFGLPGFVPIALLNLWLLRSTPHEAT